MVEGAARIDWLVRNLDTAEDLPKVSMMEHPQ